MDRVPFFVINFLMGAFRSRLSPQLEMTIPFFVIQHASREVLHVQVTRHPTADWAAQQIVEACAWDRAPPDYLIHDRDSRYGAAFDRRLQRLAIKQIRTPFR